MASVFTRRHRSSLSQNRVYMRKKNGDERRKSKEQCVRGQGRLKQGVREKNYVGRRRQTPSLLFRVSEEEAEGCRHHPERLRLVAHTSQSFRHVPEDWGGGGAEDMTGCVSE